MADDSAGSELTPIGAGVALIIMLFLIFGVAAVVRGTWQRSGRWGLNIGMILARFGFVKNDAVATRCPECGTPFPMVRKPDSLSQMLWGGWTCSGCGGELDKWGNVRSE